MPSFTILAEVDLNRDRHDPPHHAVFFTQVVTIQEEQPLGRDRHGAIPVGRRRPCSSGNWRIIFNKEGFEDEGGEGKWDKTETPEGLKFKTHFFPAFTFCQCL